MWSLVHSRVSLSHRNPLNDNLRPKVNQDLTCFKEEPGLLRYGEAVHVWPTLLAKEPRGRGCDMSADIAP